MTSGANAPQPSGDDRTVFFTKLHGCGNDYVFVRTEEHAPALAEALRQHAPELSRQWSDRHTGIGADGLVLVEPSPDSDARLVMYNSDGSRGALCVNALRCVARLTWEATGRSELLLSSDTANHRARVRPGVGPQFQVRVELAPPRFAPGSIPLEAPDHDPGADLDPIAIELGAGGARWAGWALSVGNPHLVLPLETDPRDLDVPTLGAELERAPCFPDRINVTFAQVLEPGRARLRTFERGSGETAACGSGACAAAVVLTHRLGLRRGSPWTLSYPGGELLATWEQDGRISLEGPAEVAYRGQVRCPIAPQAPLPERGKSAAPGSAIQAG